jgi:hypothetical protein
MRRMCSVLSKIKMQTCFGSRQTDTPERQKNKNRFQTFFGCIFQPFATRSFDFVVIRDRCAVHHPCRRKRRRGLSDGSSF